MCRRTHRYRRAAPRPRLSPYHPCSKSHPHPDHHPCWNRHRCPPRQRPPLRAPRHPSARHRSQAPRQYRLFPLRKPHLGRTFPQRTHWRKNHSGPDLSTGPRKYLHKSSSLPGTRRGRRCTAGPWRTELRRHRNSARRRPGRHSSDRKEIGQDPHNSFHTSHRSRARLPHRQRHNYRSGCHRSARRCSRPGSPPDQAGRCIARRHTPDRSRRICRTPRSGRDSRQDRHSRDRTEPGPQNRRSRPHHRSRLPHRLQFPRDSPRRSCHRDRSSVMNRQQEAWPVRQPGSSFRVVVPNVIGRPVRTGASPGSRRPSTPVSGRRKPGTNLRTAVLARRGDQARNGMRGTWALLRSLKTCLEPRNELKC